MIRSALANFGANLSRSDIAKAEIKVSSDENPSLSLSKASSLQPGFSPPKNIKICSYWQKFNLFVCVCFVVAPPPPPPPPILSF